MFLFRKKVIGMRIGKFQPNNSIERKISGFIYRIEKLNDEIFLISKILDGQIVSEYLVELHGFCTCPDFQKRRIKNNQACKHIQMLLLALAKYPEFKQVFIYFDENFQKLL